MTTQYVKIESITVIGKRWLDKPNGNTYFSAVGLINGKEVVSIHFEYGYDECYLQCIQRELEKNGFLPDLEHYSNGAYEALWQYCKRNKITLYKSVSNVNKRKDL